MNAIAAANPRQAGVAVQREMGAVPARDRQQRARQRNLIVFGQILLAQTDPAATGGERRADHVGQWRPRLMSVRDKEERRVGKLHVPTRPNCGLDGSACASLGIRPASRACRPASTAARIAFAISTGSRAFETAVLSSTAE